MWINKPIMVERRSFELLSLYNSKQPIFKNLKHFHINPKGIAIIRIYGVLTKKTEAFDHILDMTSYENIHEEIESALEDKSIETILLDIDSPGGEVNGVFDLADFIYSARGKKRIIAIANDDAYSAAYAIASSAEKIFLTRTSGVGSIGVIASHIDQSRFDEKQGIKYTTIFAGSRKNDLNPHEPMTSESLGSLQKEVDRLYEMFLQLIARNRGLSIEKIRSTEAGLYFGEKAVEIGLADGVTTFFEFINNHRSVSMSAPSKVRKVQLVKIQSRQSLASNLEQTTMLRKVTSVVKLVEWTTQGTTKVKVLSPEILDEIEVDTFHVVEDSKKGNNKASYHSLYRDRRPYHVLRWSLRKLGRSFAFLLRYGGTSQQRRGLTEDAKEVGLTDSTQSVGKPHTRGSGQQYSDWFRDCYANTTEVGITCKEN